MTRAADELHLAQPALSRSLRRLEDELGVPLFHRHGRRLALNRFGEGFLRRVDRALLELDDAGRELADADGLEHGAVAVAAETLRTLTPLLGAFLAEHPGVRLRLHELTAAAMADALRAGHVDLCLASLPLGAPGLREVELATEEVLLAVPRDHPLAGAGRVGVTALAEAPLVTTRPGHWQRALADALLARAGLQATIACEGDEPAAIRGLVSAGVGVGLVPESSRVAAADPPVAWLHVDAPGCVRTLRLAWRADGYLSAAARAFCDLATRTLAAAPAAAPG